MSYSETLDHYWALMQIADTPEVFAMVMKARRELIEKWKGKYETTSD